jgi:ABC-type lipoprotein export system ATPase subunit
LISENEATNATLTKVFDISEEETYNPILKNINLEIKKGEFVAFVGEYLNFN